LSEPAKEEEKKPLTTEEILSKLAAESYENRRAINAIAEAMVKLKQDIDTLKAGGGGAGAGTPSPKAVEDLLKAFGLGEKKETDLESIVKSAKALAELSDSLDRFRNPARLDLGIAWLARLGMRAAFPRYMTKAELARREREIATLSGLEEEFEGEGETEHVK